MNLKQLRVVPSAPSAMEIATLKQALENMPLSDKEQGFAIKVAQRRLDRRMASELKGSGRYLATISKQRSKFKPKKDNEVAESYYRHEKVGHAQQAQSAWMTHLTGGEKDGEKWVGLKKKKISRKLASVTGDEDPARELVKKKQDKESFEKQKLINELSQMSAQ